MRKWEGGNWSWELRWRQELRVCEKEWVMELMNVLQRFTIKETTQDKWQGSANGDFLVREAYKEIEKRWRGTTNNRLVQIDYLSLWRSHTPFKAQMTSWRVLKNRLPTKDNLQKRRCLSQVDPECCCCQERLETADHLFLEWQELTPFGVVLSTGLELVGWNPEVQYLTLIISQNFLVKEAMERDWEACGHASYE